MASPASADNHPAGQMADPEVDEGALAGPARELADAARTGVPVRQLSKRFPRLTVTDAYRIQRISLEERLSAGARIAGHKVGLTSAAMQEQMGIDEPDTGVILTSMVAASGAGLRSADFVNPRIEAEIAFRLRRDLAEPSDLATARSAVGEVFLAFEVLDTVFANWDITLVGILSWLRGHLTAPLVCSWLFGSLHPMPTARPPWAHCAAPALPDAIRRVAAHRAAVPTPASRPDLWTPRLEERPRPRKWARLEPP
ncbi:2-keto-4-pentenoate hydratase [Streptomyces sp. NPDC002078]